MNYLMNLLIALDQLGNTLAGGNPDSTISGRVGFRASKGGFYWKTLERIINFTFKPIDGPRHCYNAFLNDNENIYHGDTFSMVILSILVALGCLFLIPIIRVIAWIMKK